MKKIIISILIFSFALSGCSRIITRNDYEIREKYYQKINKICEDKDELIIKVYENEEYKGKEIKISDDYTTFINLSSNTLKKINTRDIVQIKFDGTGTEGFEGFLFGALAGAGISVLLIPQNGEGPGTLLVIAGLIAVGSIVGLIFSTSTDITTTIDFTK
ncbi:MAG: hypothetical protein KJ571_13515 [Bacteroidetes bacterium]|nr:hypothetical protein [Bacteroidota bacterium]